MRINLADTCIDDRAFDTIGSHCKGLQVILMKMVIEIRINRAEKGDWNQGDDDAEDYS